LNFREDFGMSLCVWIESEAIESEKKMSWWMSDNISSLCIFITLTMITPIAVETSEKFRSPQVSEQCLERERRCPLSHTGKRQTQINKTLLTH
jgi:hypothetical protein